MIEDMRKCIIDIEVFMGESPPEPGDPRGNEITSIALWDSKTERYVCLLNGDELYKRYETLDLGEGVGEVEVWIEEYPNEHVMLGACKHILGDVWDVDMIIGWNVEEFDMTYMFHRMEHLGIGYRELAEGHEGYTYQSNRGYWNVTLKGREILDLKRAYKDQHVTGIRSSALEYISQDELGYGKLKSEKSLDKLWLEEPKDLVRYNLKDVILCEHLDDRLDISDNFIQTSYVTGCDIDDNYYNSAVFDSFMLSHAEDEIVLPTRMRSKGRGHFEGATVFEPEGGLHEMIGVFDLSKLYPSIMITLDMSPERVIPADEIDDYSEDEYYHIEIKEKQVDDSGEDSEVVEVVRDLYLMKEPEGFIPRRLKEMFQMRYDVEEEREKYEPTHPMYDILGNRIDSIKQQINSTYGMLSYEKSRFFLPEFIPDAELLPPAVTKIGREILKFSKEIAEEFGYEVIYGDTDSIFIKGIETIEEGKQLERMLNKAYDEIAEKYGVDEHWFEMEFEKMYEKVLIKPERKKRYCGNIVWEDGKKLEEPKFDVTGFEIRRSDTPEWMVDFQEEKFKRVLDGKSEEEMYDWIVDKMDEVREGEVDMFEIAFPRGLNKMLDEYSDKTIHARGSEYSNENLGTRFSVGDKPRYLYVSEVPEGYPETDVICLDFDTEVPDGFEIDERKMLERLVLKKIDTIDECMDWDLESALTIDVDLKENNQKQLLEYGGG